MAVGAMKPPVGRLVPMSHSPKLNFDRLVAHIMLDLNLLHWFAVHGQRQEILDVIATLRARPEDHAVLDLIEHHISHDCGQAAPSRASRRGRSD